MKNPCEDCLINIICGDLCEQRKEYTQDVSAELNGQIILFKKGMITEEKYTPVRNLFRKVHRRNFKITNGIEEKEWEGICSPILIPSDLQIWWKV
jgi:hypothetical protein